MDRLDDVISEMAYALDSLMALRNIQATGNCNECELCKNCEYSPEPGSMVRYNCPFFKREK